MSIYHFARNDRRHGIGPFAANYRSALYRGLAAIARHATYRIDRFLHCLIDALAASKMRRLERELQWRGVTYARLPDRGSEANK